MFLDDVDLQGVKACELRRKMSNWMKVADLIYEGASEDDILTMMKIEAMSKNRDYILSRLHSRFTAMRSKRERKELQEWLENLTGRVR